MNSRAALKKAADDAAAAYEAEVKRVQSECQHPVAQLELTAGACQSYSAASTDREVWIRCKACDASFTRWVRWHND